MRICGIIIIHIHLSNGLQGRSCTWSLWILICALYNISQRLHRYDTLRYISQQRSLRRCVATITSAINSIKASLICKQIAPQDGEGMHRRLNKANTWDKKTQNEGIKRPKATKEFAKEKTLVTENVFKGIKTDNVTD